MIQYIQHWLWFKFSVYQKDVCTLRLCACMNTPHTHSYWVDLFLSLAYWLPFRIESAASSLQIYLERKCQDDLIKWILFYSHRHYLQLIPTKLVAVRGLIQTQRLITLWKYLETVPLTDNFVAFKHKGRQDYYLNAAQSLICHILMGTWGCKGEWQWMLKKTHSLISINTSLMLMAFLALVSTKMAWMESA